MKQFFLLVFISLVAASISFGQTKYQFKVDLNEVSNDKLRVELAVPAIPKSNKVLSYNLPKIVPGTYSIYDFGRFVSDFKALKKNGKPLKVTHPTPNTWTIAKAHKMKKITYTVDDTWDTNLDNKAFEPCGSNFEKSNYVFNNHAIFGYLDGMKRVPFNIEVDRPASFRPATSMDRVGGDEDTDIFEISNYMDLVDAPVMFSEPDFTYINVGAAKVLVAVYSPTGKVTSKFIAGEIEPILQAQREYLGGKLPIDKYAFIIYLTDGVSASGAYGALEHSYSSFYYLPEMDPANIAQTIRDVAAHEFFHIVTPLNVHSEEIHDFDFINPKMSKHLWMYEGVTEYSAGHVQVKHGLMPIEQYLDVIAEKVRGAERHNDKLPFTEMSSGCLHTHKDEYLNVYQKGALIGMCMDLELRSLSSGKYGIQNLMADLSKEYGKNQAFKDDELFDKIEKLTYPEIRSFLNTHVAGSTPLPIKSLLEKVGIEYAPVKMVKEKTVGGLENALGVDFGTGSFYIEKPEMLDGFGKSMGFIGKDVIKSWNGVDLNLQNINQVLTDFMMKVEVDDPINIVVNRDGKEKELKSTFQMAEVERKHAFSLVEAPTEEQLQLRTAWLGDYKTATEGGSK